MAEKTVLSLAQDVYQATINLGMGVNAKDVAFIISTFLEGLAAHPSHPDSDGILLRIAEDVNKLKDVY